MGKKGTNRKRIFIFSLGIATLWLAEGLFLLMQGIKTLLSPHLTSSGLLTWMSSFVSKRQDAELLLIAIGFMIAYFQGKFVFSKFIEKLTQKTQIEKFPIKEVLFFVSWAFIGSGLQLFLFEDFCAWLDFVIGASLLNSTPFFLKNLFSFKKEMA